MAVIAEMEINVYKPLPLPNEETMNIESHSEYHMTEKFLQGLTDQQLFDLQHKIAQDYADFVRISCEYNFTRVMYASAAKRIQEIEATAKKILRERLFGQHTQD